MTVVISNTFFSEDIGHTPLQDITEIYPVAWPVQPYQIFNIQNGTMVPDTTTKHRNQWVIQLRTEQDPITQLEFYTHTLNVLWDTGSNFSVISSHTIQEILPDWKSLVKNVDFNTLGPDSRQILCYGKIDLEFKIMGDLYSDTFLVLHSRFDNTLIGYGFMRREGVTIKAGHYLTNSDKPHRYLNQVNAIYDGLAHETINTEIPLVLTRNTEIIPGAQTNLHFEIGKSFQDSIPKVIYSMVPVTVMGNIYHEQVPIGPQGTLVIPYTEQICNVAYTLDAGTENLATIFSQGTTYINNMVSPHDMVCGYREEEEEQAQCQGLEFSKEGIHYPQIESAAGPPIAPVQTPTNIPIEVLENCHPCSICHQQKYTMCDPVRKDCALHINNASQFHNKICLLALYQRTDQQNFLFIHCNDFYMLKNLLSDYWIRAPIQSVLYSYFLVNQSVVLFVENNTLTSEEKCLVLAKKIKFLSYKYFLPEVCVTGFAQDVIQALHKHTDIQPLTIQTTTGSLSSICPMHPLRNKERINAIRKIDSKELEASIYTKDPNLIRSMAQVIQERSQLYAINSFDIGLWSKDGIPYEIHIRLTDPTPVVHKFRHLHHSKMDQAIEIMRGLREAGIISRKVTPYASGAVWTLKAVPMMTKEEANQLGIEYVPGVESKIAKRPLRLTVNLRDVNTKISTAACILPNVKTIFPEIRKSEILSIIDLLSAYWSLKYTEESSRITGFSCGIPDEQIHTFERVVMGLRSSQAALTSALYHTIGTLRDNVFSYSDNLVIHSRVDNHAEIVNKVLSSLEAAGFKLSLSKSIFAISGDVKLFGLVYNPTLRLVSPDQSKMETLSSLKAPTSFSQLRSFLGSINFVVNHLEGIKEDMAVLFSLTRDNKSFNWTTEAQRSYENIIKAVQNYHKLHVLDHKSLAILSVDSSVAAAGGLLCQIHPETGKILVNSFYQKLFSSQESRLMNFEREALGLATIYKMAANVTFGTRLIVACDCRAVIALKFLGNQNHKVSRWLSTIEAHQPKITFIHLKNTTDLIKIADYISRTPPLKAIEVPLSEQRFKQTPRDTRDKRTTKEDIARIQTISNKIRKEPYTIEQYEIILDYLTSLEEKDLMSIDDETVMADQSFVIFRRSGKAYEKIEVGQRLKPYRPLDDISLGNIRISDMRADDSVTITHPTDSSLPFSSTLGINNVTASAGDSLRNHNDIPLRFLSYFTMKFPHIDMQEVRRLQKEDPRCKATYEKCLNGNKLRWAKNETNHFLIRQGVLLHENAQSKQGTIQLYLPEHLIFDTLNSIHRMYAHPGANRLQKLFMDYFYAPGIARHINNLLAQCYICAVNKPAPQLKRPLNQHTVYKSLETPSLLFSTDIIKVSNNPGGTNSLLSFTCCLTLYTFSYPIKADMTSRTYIDILLHCFLPAVNFTAKFLVSDNAKYYTSNFTKQALAELGIKMVTICPYSPSNNPSERIQKQILSMLKVTMQEKSLPPNSWPQIIQYITTILNSTPYSNIPFPLSPADLFFGRKCHPIGLIPFLDCTNDQSLNTPLAEDMCRTRKILQNFVAHIEKIRKEFYLKHKANIKANTRNEILPGDIVAHQELAHNLIGYNKKLRPRYRDLYMVITTSSTAAFCRPLETSQTKRSTYKKDQEVKGTMKNSHHNIHDNQGHSNSDQLPGQDGEGITNLPAHPTLLSHPFYKGQKGALNIRDQLPAPGENRPAGNQRSGAALIKIDKKYLKKIKAAVLFPVGSKIFNENFQNPLPEKMDFYFLEDQENFEDTYLLPNSELCEEEDCKAYEPIPTLNLNRISQVSSSIKKNKRVCFNDNVHCVMISKGHFKVSTSCLNNKYTLCSDNFFGDK